jgi:hypothetical protein
LTGAPADPPLHEQLDVDGAADDVTVVVVRRPVGTAGAAV